MCTQPKSFFKHLAEKMNFKLGMINVLRNVNMPLSKFPINYHIHKPQYSSIYN